MRGKRNVYLDYAAATPVDKRVVRAMRPFFGSNFGNPGGLHRMSLAARKAVADARAVVAGALGARTHEIVFTASGTESNNLAIIGAIRGYTKNNPDTTPHVIVSSIEHKAVLAAVRALSANGEIELTEVPVTTEGMVEVRELQKALRPNTALVSIMYANNEVGTIQPIKEIAKAIRHHRKNITRSPYPLFHTDAIQAFQYCPTRVPQLGVDLLSISGAKIYGPKGVAALYVKTGVLLEPMVYGGGQEQGLRSGTENVPLIVGFAKAVTIAEAFREKETTRLQELQQYFVQQLRSLDLVARTTKDAAADNLRVNGSLEHRLPNNVNVTFPGISGERMVIELDARGIYVSAQSACTAEDAESSYVITSLYPEANTEDGGVRFSMGRMTTKRDLALVVRELQTIIARIRSANEMLQL